MYDHADLVAGREGACAVGDSLLCLVIVSEKVDKLIAVLGGYVHRGYRDTVVTVTLRQMTKSKMSQRSPSDVESKWAMEGYV